MGEGPLSDFTICGDFWHCVFQYQTLLSGAVAVAAAVFTTITIYRAAKLPIHSEEKRRAKEEARKLDFAKNQLGVEMRQVQQHARSVLGTIKVTVAANSMVNDEIKNRCMFQIGKILSDWDFVSLFPDDGQLKMIRFKAQLEDFNRSIEKTGGAFGANNWQDYLYTQLRFISNGAADIAALSGTNLPREQLQ